MLDTESRWHKIKWAIKKWWVTKILKREWKVGWKWYGGYAVVNKDWKFRTDNENMA